MPRILLVTICGMGSGAVRQVSVSGLVGLDRATSGPAPGLARP
jgi:hypothetical protein